MTRLLILIFAISAATPCLGQAISTLTPIRKGHKVVLPTYKEPFYSDRKIDRDSQVQGRKVIDLGIVTECKELNYSLVEGKLITDLRIYIRIKRHSDTLPRLDGDYWDKIRIEMSDKELLDPSVCRPIEIHRFFELPNGIYKADLWLFDDKHRRASLIYLAFKVEN